MLKKERQKRIIELLEQDEFLSVTELSNELKVSEMTVRRDINELAEGKKLLRLYGGAQKLNVKDSELSTNEKINLHVDQKRYIGSIMNSIVEDGDIIYLGAGTTIFYGLPYLKKKKLFVITNSLISFDYLIGNTDYRVHLTGGEYNPLTEEFTGEHSERLFKDINIDIAFAATNGIYNDNVTTASMSLGNVQKAAFNSSKRRYIVADSSKFNTSDLYTFCKIEELDGIITDNLIGKHNYNYYSEFGKIIYKPIKEAKK